MELNCILTVSFMKRRNFLKTLTRREKSPSGKRPRTKHWFAFRRREEQLYYMQLLLNENIQLKHLLHSIWRGLHPCDVSYVFVKTSRVECKLAQLKEFQCMEILLRSMNKIMYSHLKMGHIVFTPTNGFQAGRYKLLNFII